MPIKMKTKIKIPPHKWVQIGGDVNYETDGLILGYYNPNQEEITVVQIEPPTADLKTFFGQEATYDLEELSEYKLEEFGLNPKEFKKHGLELIAEELLITQGGEPIDCGAGGFLQDLHEEFPNFDTALACIIRQESFTDFNGNEVTPEKEKIKKPIPYKGRY